MEIEFYGAAGTVTGSKHLITLEDGSRILLDCGMFQGRGKESDAKNRHFGFDPQSIDYLILSHAHIDHSGLIPRLIRQGFRGIIYCTFATYDLCEILLKDSAFIQESDTSYLNKRRQAEQQLKPLYSLEDVVNCLPAFVPVPYNHPFKISPDIQLTFIDAGHILGAAVVHLEIKEKKRDHKLTFTGDIGRYTNKILKVPQPFPSSDTIICEATYGNRIHQNEEEAEKELLKIVKETCVMNKGKLIIPAFSVGKTQEIIYALNRLEFAQKLPKIKVFVDSPLAINATDIMKRHRECFGEDILSFMQQDPDPFGFNLLTYVQDASASKALNQLKEPCIIISASGMMDAGRVKHHLLHHLGNSRNALLIIGYCEPSSLGGRILQGDRLVSIFGQQVEVNAAVYQLDYYSAHADYREILQFLSCQDPGAVERMFLVHGNPDALSSLKQRLYEEGFSNVQVAEAEVRYKC